MSDRIAIPPSLQATILVECRRRCCLCVYLSGDWGEKKGQIAHIDRDPANAAAGNLAFLCLDHHDQYDSKTRQSKGITEAELRVYRQRLRDAASSQTFPPSDSSARVTVSACPTKSGGKRAIAFTIENAGPRPVRIKSWYAIWGTKRRDRFVESCRGGLPVVLQEREEYRVLAELDHDDFEGISEVGVKDSDGNRWLAAARCLSLFAAAMESDRRLAYLQPPPAQTPAVDATLLSLSCMVEAVNGKGQGLRIRVANSSDNAVTLDGASISWEHKPDQSRGANKLRALEIGGAIELPMPESHIIAPSTASSLWISSALLQFAIGAASDDVTDEHVFLDLRTSSGQRIRLQHSSLRACIVELAKTLIGSAPPAAHQ